MYRKSGFFFHPEDWLSDAKLALCSHATKGAWIDLMCYMYQSKRSGYLMIDNRPLTKEDIRRVLKCSSDAEFEQIWKELTEFGVMRQDDTGTYYSKRMVEDMERISMASTATDEEMELAQKVLEEFKRVYPELRSYDGGEARSVIIARKREGYTFEDFKSVIASKCAEWKDVDKMVKSIKPIVFFGDKFHRYVAESKDDQKAVHNPYEHRIDHGYDW